MSLVNEEGKPSSTGFVQAEAVWSKVQEWKVARNVAALCFDTTASNTGHVEI